ncbi:MAG: hypothetical protein ACXV74_05135 [Methylobacter sp.]
MLHDLYDGFPVGKKVLATPDSPEATDHDWRGLQPDFDEAEKSDFSIDIPFIKNTIRKHQPTIHKALKTIEITSRKNLTLKTRAHILGRVIFVSAMLRVRGYERHPVTINLPQSWQDQIKLHGLERIGKELHKKAKARLQYNIPIMLLPDISNHGNLHLHGYVWLKPGDWEIFKSIVLDLLKPPSKFRQYVIKSSLKDTETMQKHWQPIGDLWGAYSAKMFTSKAAFKKLKNTVNGSMIYTSNAIQKGFSKPGFYERSRSRIADALERKRNRETRRKIDTMLTMLRKSSEKPHITPTRSATILPQPDYAKAVEAPVTDSLDGELLDLGKMTNEELELLCEKSS